MKLVRTLWAVSLVVSHGALAGVQIDTPLTAGAVVTLDADHEVNRVELSQTQLHALSQWLETHKARWSGEFTPHPMQMRSYIFALKDASGKAGTIEVFPNSDGGGFLLFSSSTEKWSYQSSGGLFKSWAAGQALSSDDMSRLLGSLGIAQIQKGRFAAAETLKSILGRYKSVTESEWQLELELKSKGIATYTLSNWQPGQSAKSMHKTKVTAQWVLKDGVLTITYPGSTPEQSVAYEVSSCLSHKSFGGTKCSPGLRPVSNDMGRQYSQQLWNEKAFKFPY